MDRSLLEDRITSAELRITTGYRNIARQRRVVDALAHYQQDTKRAADLLHVFERAQASHLAERDRLRSELLKSI